MLWTAYTQRFIKSFFLTRIENTDTLTTTTEKDLTLVESWQYRLAGNFFVVRALKNYTVLLTDFAPHARAYGVVGLTDSMAETMILPLPVYIQTVLLPFEDRIIYDSLLTTYNPPPLALAKERFGEFMVFLTTCTKTAPSNKNIYPYMDQQYQVECDWRSPAMSSSTMRRAS